MPKGHLAFVLHAHLPYVRHPEYEHFLEERWFFEAMTESYLPLVAMLKRLSIERVPYRLTISLSPTLLTMMEDSLLQQRYLRHLDLLIELSRKEQTRNVHNGHFKWLAEQYESIFSSLRDLYLSVDCRISKIFAAVAAEGNIELITTTATHAVVPLLRGFPQAIEAQIEVGLSYFESVFGFRPHGLWLPECGYVPGIEEFLRSRGIRYFISESVAVEHANVAPVYGVHAPLFTPNGVAVFARDPSCTEEVWSSRRGYPGDPLYREFYRDIGFDLDINYIRPYIVGDIRVDTGIKYYRVTGATANKQPYDFYHARERAALHAGDFLNKRINQICHLATYMKTPPIVTAPFDAELFGHWWFEGPQWLEYVIRKIAFDQDVISLVTPGLYLEANPVHQSAVPRTSTWGRRASFETWVNGKVDWILLHIDSCNARMTALSNYYTSHEPPELIRRALNQCMRELLLAQSSDWPFIITGGTSEQYAIRRIRDHIARFNYLAQRIEEGTIPLREIEALEFLDAIFPNADFRIFATKKEFREKK